MKRAFYSLFLMYILAACGGGSASESAEQSTEDTTTIEEVETVVEPVVEVVIEGNDLMQYNLNKIEVTEGQKVKLTLKHVGQMSAEAMGHNWVLLALGTSVSDFGMAAVSAKETGYIPDSMKDKVIAATKVIGGGEETTIEFDSPKPGFYDFICSFPGHYGLMKGTFTVLPK